MNGRKGGGKYSALLKGRAGQGPARAAADGEGRREYTSLWMITNFTFFNRGISDLQCCFSFRHIGK